MSYSIERVTQRDRRLNRLINALLEQEGIQRDENLDYTCAMVDDDYNVIATGSCFGNTLRCFAVSSKHQGEGLLNEILSHLMEVQMERGNTHLFVYTKNKTAKFFGDLGFYKVAEVADRVVFMENRRNGFQDFVCRLVEESPKAKVGARVGAIVMNANPFTLGHQYLVEQAAADCDILHLFVVSEDKSLVPFEVRKRLIREGTAHLEGIVLHETGPYLISSATFPSYFLKEEALVCRSHAQLDVSIFGAIAKELGITCRYVGEERASQVTGIYNEVMAAQLPEYGVECRVIPRKEENGAAISASTVRQCIHDGAMEQLKALVPETTMNYLLSAEAQPVLDAIRAEENVIHY